MRQEKSREIPSEVSLNSRSAIVSQGFLADCMVDADPNASSRAGKARGRALGISAFAQACVLTLILIVPLFAVNHRITVINAVPIAPYGGMPRHGSEAKPNDANHRPAPAHRTPTNIQLFRPPSNTNKRDDADDDKGAVGSRDFIPPGTPWLGGGSNSDRIGIIQTNGLSDGPEPPRPPLETAPPVKPVAVSEGAELAQLLSRVEPVYPIFAIHSHLEGTVELRAIIGRDGVVRELRVLSGNPILAYAAQEAVKQWRFRPTMLNGQPVEVDTFFTVVFKIKQ
jgi:TonB family protein